MAGAASEGYGSASDLGTAFNVEQSMFHTGTLGICRRLRIRQRHARWRDSRLLCPRSNEGYSQSLASDCAALFRSRHRSAWRSAGSHRACLIPTASPLAIFWISRWAERRRHIQFLGREVNAFRPGGYADFHLASNTILEYRYATSEPNTRASKGFDSAPADLSESGPRMTMINGEPLLENAHHHEISLSQRLGANKCKLAYFNDRVKDPALLGVGDVTWTAATFCPTFTPERSTTTAASCRPKACASSSSAGYRTI